MTSEKTQREQLLRDLEATRALYRVWAHEVAQWEEADEQERQQLRQELDHTLKALGGLAAALADLEEGQ